MLARIPLGLNHPSDKNTRRSNKLEHILTKTSDISDVSNIGKVDPLFRDMLYRVRFAGGSELGDSHFWLYRSWSGWKPATPAVSRMSVIAIAMPES
jgi:hypothetical protein